VFGRQATVPVCRWMTEEPMLTAGAALVARRCGVDRAGRIPPQCRRGVVQLPEYKTACSGFLKMHARVTVSEIQREFSSSTKFRREQICFSVSAFEISSHLVGGTSVCAFGRRSVPVVNICLWCLNSYYRLRPAAVLSWCYLKLSRETMRQQGNIASSAPCRAAFDNSCPI
jgi:hypothetical protein